MMSKAKSDTLSSLQDETFGCGVTYAAYVRELSREYFPHFMKDKHLRIRTSVTEFAERCLKGRQN